MGRIGQEIAKRLAAFDVEVVYHSRNRVHDVSYPHYPALMEMARNVDTMIVIVPGGKATEKLINADVLAALGTNGVFVNVARGNVVDELAPRPQTNALRRLLDRRPAEMLQCAPKMLLGDGPKMAVAVDGFLTCAHALPSWFS